MIVDAHLHVWDPGRRRYDWLGPGHAPIDRVVTPEEALDVLGRHGAPDAHRSVPCELTLDPHRRAVCYRSRVGQSSPG